MTDFSNVAKYYKYRHAYLPAFFEGCADTLKLDGSQRQLDVACGTGVVARGYSTYVDSIVAFDGNRNMIDIALEKSADYPNIQFLHTTFNDLPSQEGRLRHRVRIGVLERQLRLGPSLL
jgi:ubiquinone/menaquinone biosynthesis C-methylase UbiE